MPSLPSQRFGVQIAAAGDVLRPMELVELGCESHPGGSGMSPAPPWDAGDVCSLCCVSEGGGSGGQDEVR